MSRELKEKENFINSLFQQKDLELQKIAKLEGRTPEEITQLRQQLRDKMNEAKKKAGIELGDSLDQLQSGGVNVGKGTTLSKGLDQSKLPDASKIKGLGKSNMFSKTLGAMGKKAAGIIPFAGAGLAALHGDPAMAAEELASDAAGPAGMAYEALKPEIAGNPEEEKQMLVEDRARKNYKNSQAYKDKRGMTSDEQDDENLPEKRKVNFSKLRGMFGD